jgi:hypothetical protein
MKYGLTAVFFLALGLCACVGVGPAGASGGSSCVMTFFRSDVNGDGVVDAEDSGSGAADITNAAGMACPAGWFYIGHTETQPICQQG